MVEKRGNVDESLPEFVFPFCPRCGSPLSSNVYGDRYCESCNVKLDFDQVTWISGTKQVTPIEARKILDKVKLTNETDTMVHGTPFLKLMKSSKGYYYAERKGKDSIAVLVYKREGGNVKVLIRMQPLVFNQGTVDGIDKTGYEHLPRDVLVPCPITGSITGKYESFVEYAIEEIGEEAGFIVKKDEIQPLSMYYVGTQTNEVVHCFACDVTGKKQLEPEGDGTYWERVSMNEWHDLWSIEDLEINYAGLIIVIARLKKLLEFSPLAPDKT